MKELSAVHIKSLDGIRGFAISLILLYHHFGLQGGWLGVDLFFVLSGFLITGILLDTKQSKSYFLNFYARRVLRIFPLYFMVLIGFFIVLPILTNIESSKSFSIYFDDQLYYWFYLQNWAQLFKVHEYEGVNRVLSHFWSLAIEEQFYVFWPLFIAFFSMKNLKIVILTLISASLVFKIYLVYNSSCWEIAYLNTFSRIDTILVGALVALGIRQNNFTRFSDNRLSILVYTLLSLAFVIIIFSGAKIPEGWFFSSIGYLFFATVFGSIIFKAISEPSDLVFKILFENKIAIFMGKFSYSIYVFHFPVIWLVQPRIYSLTFFQNIDFGVAFIIANIISIILTLIISQLTWYIIEQPFLKLKNRFS